jgi:sugar lactone lactonase YvrE
MKFRICAISVIAVLFTLTGCSGDDEEIGWHKTGELNFPDDTWEPVGIAIGPEDSIAVADMSPLCQIHLFDDDGVLIGSLGEIGKEAGQLFLPIDVWVDCDGNVYIAETETARVTVFDKTGELVTTIAPEGVKVPFAVAAENPDEIYIVDIEATDVLVVDGDGKILDNLGEKLKLEGPEDVAVSGDRVAIIDAVTGKTLLCDKWGEILYELSVEGDPLFVPHEVAFGPEGDIYVLGLRVEEGPEGVLEGYVVRFDDSGGFVERIALNTQKPTSVAVNSEGDLLVGDGTAHVVEVYSKN